MPAHLKIRDGKPLLSAIGARLARLAVLFLGAAAVVCPAPTLASVCTLADHIRAANTNRAVGHCPAGTSHDIITITDDIVLSEGLPAITGTITIEGGGHTISGAGKVRHFVVDGGNLTVNNLRLADGFSEDGGGAIHVRNRGWLAVYGSTFTGNVAGLFGGAIDVQGATRFENKYGAVTGVNYSQGRGLTVRESSFIGNQSGDEGGALSLYGRTNISNSSFVDNFSAASGGAIYALGEQINISNSTFSRNRSKYSGGAIALRHAPGGGAALTHLTMLDNALEGNGKGQALSISEFSDNVTLANSVIFGGGIRGKVCEGRLNVNIANIIEREACSPPLKADPRLGVLTGSPAYYAPLDGSPALDAADPRFCPDFDQIGRPRPQGAGCDIGAIESTTASPAPPVIPAVCPLPDQIIAANSDAPVGNCPAGNGADTIYLIRDITLDAALPPITSEILIEGNGHAINGAERFRIFDVDGGKLRLRDLELREGSATQGGALRLLNGARVHASTVAFVENSAISGGAIATESLDVQLDIDDSRFAGNRASGPGGAILVDGGSVTISRSAFLGNKTGELQFGGALLARRGSVDISNSTFSGNRAAKGGAIYSNGAAVTLTHLTLMNNRAGQILGAGIYHQAGALRLRNSIVAGSGRGDDCYGPMDEKRGNFSQDGSCASEAGGEPLLGDLVEAPAHYPLLDASPAHGRGDSRYCLEADQLGNPRPHCDIGAIESARDASIAAAPPIAALPENCALADQIIAANTDAPAGSCPAGDGADTIVLRQSVTLSEPLPAITSDLIINGGGHTISGSERVRIFEIIDGAVTIKHVALEAGRAPAGENGGAILQRGGELTIAKATFRGNRAWRGGAVAQFGNQLKVYDNRFLDNAAEDIGGGIFFGAGCHSVGDNEFKGNRSSTTAPAHSVEAPFGAAMEFAGVSGCGSVHGVNDIS